VGSRVHSPGGGNRKSSGRRAHHSPVQHPYSSEERGPREISPGGSSFQKGEGLLLSPEKVGRSFLAGSGKQEGKVGEKSKFPWLEGRVGRKREEGNKFPWLQKVMSEGKEGERPGIRLQQASTDSGLLDLGDVSNDLAALAQALSPGGSGHSENSDCGDSNTDCDYDNLSSPGGSSTCSGPTYRRHAGFGPDLGSSAQTPRSGGSWPPSPLNKSLSTSHIGSTAAAPRPRLSRLSAQHTLPDNVSCTKEERKKKKKNLLFADLPESADVRGLQVGQGGPGSRPLTKLGSASSTRSRHKKEPLPMKLRSLPQSFWQQPNVENPLSPGAVYSTLPPLPGQGASGEWADHVPPLAEVAGEDAEATLDHRRTERTVTSANTDLLFSLFNGVEEEEAQRKIHLVRRGRPKKPPTVHRVRGMQQDDDPCLVSTMTESLLPFLPERGGGGAKQQSSQQQGTQVIKLMSISHGDRSVDLPSLNVEHNYPHLLSELVMKL